MDSDSHGIALIIIFLVLFQIGIILCDSHDVAQVKSVTGSKILWILNAHGLAPDFSKDLYHLIKKAVAIRKHLERNRTRILSKDKVKRTCNIDIVIWSLFKLTRCMG